MVKEAAGFGIERCNRRQVFRIQFKIEDADILEHPFLADGFGKRNNASLHDPAQNDLGNAFVVLRGY